MKPQNKAGIVYLILVVIMYGGVLWFAATIADDYDDKEAIVTKEYIDIEYDYVLENVHDIVYQKVTTTFHDYTVIIYKGQVVDKGVIHHANCKCKN